MRPVTPRPAEEIVEGKLYQLVAPTGRHTLDVVLFHGLQLSNSTSAYQNTWIGSKATGNVSWPHHLLAKDFPGARILSVSYDAGARRTNTSGRTDVATVAKGLLHDLVNSGEVGKDARDVVFVAHSLGGLVAKHVLVQASENANPNPSTTPQHLDERMPQACAALLAKMRAIVFYGTPHLGAMASTVLGKFSGAPMLQTLTAFNEKSTDINAQFSNLRNGRGWRILDLYETHAMAYGMMVVEAGSAQSGMGASVPLRYNHVEICTPVSFRDERYVHLNNLLLEYSSDPLSWPRRRDEIPGVLKGFVVLSRAINRVLALDGGYVVIDEPTPQNNRRERWRMHARTRGLYVNLRCLAKRGVCAALGMTLVAYNMGKRAGARAERKRTTRQIQKPKKIMQALFAAGK